MTVCVQLWALRPRPGSAYPATLARKGPLRTKKALIIALDSGVSAATRERYEGICQRAGIPCVYLEDLGRAIGKDNRMIAAVTEAGFARMIEETYKTSQQK